MATPKKKELAEEAVEPVEDATVDELKDAYGDLAEDAKDLDTSEDDQADDFGSTMASGAFVAALGDLMTDGSLEESNAWKKKMLLAASPTLPDGSSALSFPDDFDTLPEEEKAKRLDQVIEMQRKLKTESHSE